MITKIPHFWEYDQKLETLFFFFQVSEELLNDRTVDTYRLPVCNVLTLCDELNTIYNQLNRLHQLDQYYQKYIPIIIDELIDCIHHDTVFKRILGYRLGTITDGLMHAKKEPKVLLPWLIQIEQLCPALDYIRECQIDISKMIKTSSKKKSDLELVTKNYWRSCIWFGYDRRYLYHLLWSFFNNKNIKISTPTQIDDFFRQLSYKNNKQILYVVLDSFLVEYYSSIDKNLDFRESLHFTELLEKEVSQKSIESDALRLFLKKYRDNRYEHRRNQIKMYKCEIKSRDPYSAFSILKDAFKPFEYFEAYFKHKVNNHIFIDCLYCKGDNFIPLKEEPILSSRPYIQETDIEDKIRNLICSRCLTRDSVLSLIEALRLHAEAIACNSVETSLKSFWSALEALFAETENESIRENVNYSLIRIIQKTYILKILQSLYQQLQKSIPDASFWKDELSIESWETFIRFFSAHDETSDEFKKIYNRLSQNPLLRSRLYMLRSDFSTGNKIKQRLTDHEKRIMQHLERIKRTRNLCTHAGVCMDYGRDVLSNIHNYFDYVVNYIFCRVDAGDRTADIASMVFEAKNDNGYHLSLLSEEKLSETNYVKLLFGNDVHLSKYKFES